MKKGKRLSSLTHIVEHIIDTQENQRLRFTNNCLDRFGKLILTFPMLTNVELHASEKYWFGLAQFVFDNFEIESTSEHLNDRQMMVQSLTSEH